MEMDNSVIQQILTTQGQMLQQMNAMIGQRNTPMMQDQMPQQYVPPTNQQQGLMHSPAASFAGSMLSNYYNYNPTRMSKEGQANYFADQNRAFQESAMNAANVGINGATTVGTMFMGGGLISSLALGAGAGALVAGTTGMMMNGAKTAMNYEDTLRTKGYMALNPFSSTSETGSIGFNRGETQDLAKFLRHIGPDEMMSDPEIQKVLDGGLENRLLKNTTDMEGFKKKFTNLVESVKKITVTMNQSIEEATKFMGEMERRGISSADMPQYAAGMKVASSMMGVSASLGSQMTMQVADSLTQGTGINAGLVMQTTNSNMFMSSMLSDRAKTQNPDLYQYIQNNGGAGQVGANNEQMIRQYINRNGDALLGLLGSGFDASGEQNKFSVNESRMNDLLSGKYSLQELTAQSQNARNDLTPAQQNALRNQATELFQNFAGTTQEYQIADLMKNGFQQTTPGLDDASAYKAMGLTQDMQQGNIISEMSKNARDPRVQLTMAAMNSKEADDAAMIANTPSIGQRVRYGAAKISGAFGDVGQGVSDSFSNAFYDFQMYTSGMDDRSRVKGKESYDISEEGLAKTFGSSISGLLDSAKQNNGIMNADQYDRLLSEGKQGNLSSSEIARLNAKLKDSKTSFYEKARIKNVITNATGGNDFFYKGNEILSEVGKVVEFFKGHGDEGGTFEYNGLSGSGDDSESEFAKKSKALQKSYLKEDKKLTKYLSSFGSVPEDADALEAAIRSGNADAVRALNEKSGRTNDKDSLTITGEYNSLLASERGAVDGLASFQDSRQNTEVYAKSVKGLENMLVSKGILDKGEARQIFGASSRIADSTLEAMKSKSFNREDMGRYISKMNASVLSGMSNLEGSELDDFAVKLVESSEGKITRESLFANGSNRIDPDKVTKAALSFAAASNNDMPNTLSDEAKKSAAKQTEAEVQLKDTIEGHTKTLGEMITAFQKEMTMFRDAAAKSSIGTSR
jgi:hypothetical protein